MNKNEIKVDWYGDREYVVNIDEVERERLFQEGACVGNIYDFMKNEEIDRFNQIGKAAYEYYENNQDGIRCRYNYHTDSPEESYIHSIPLSEVAARDKFVQDNNRRVSQKWFEFGLSKHVTDVRFLSTLFKRVVDAYYPDTQLEYPNPPQFMLYEDGHFIEKHRDGQNLGRVCVLIIYLSDVQENGGGELITETNSGKVIETQPFIGTFSIMDFTQNNVTHSVNMVKNGFKRISAIHFFHVKK